MTMDFLRQSDIITPDQLPYPVHVIGLGGIGSALVVPLVKLGVTEFHLWDDDFVEPHNLPNQHFRLCDVGKPKVEAAADIMSEYGDVKVTTHLERVGPDAQLEGIVISGVDSMSSRSAIWEVISRSYGVVLYLDGRLGGEELQLLTVRPFAYAGPIHHSDGPEKPVKFGDPELYEKYLFPDSEAAELPCTARSIIHPAEVLAGLVAGQITRWVRREPYTFEIRHQMKATQSPFLASLVSSW